MKTSMKATRWRWSYIINSLKETAAIEIIGTKVLSMLKYNKDINPYAVSTSYCLIKYTTVSDPFF